MATVRTKPRPETDEEPATVEELRADAESRIRQAQSSLELIIDATYPADPALVDTLGDLLHRAASDLRAAGDEFVRSWRIPQP